MTFSTKRRRLSTAVATTIVVCGLIIGPRPAYATPKDPEAKSLFEIGSDHFEAKEYKQAAQFLGDSWRREKDLATLFAWAQAERLSGNCKEAARLYKLFLESNPPPAAEAAAKEGIVQCVEVLAVESQTAPEPVPAPAPVQPDPSPSTEPTDRDTNSTPSRPWYKDPLGASLVGVGAAGAAAGAGLLIASQVTLPQDATNYQEHNDQYDLSQRLKLAGAITLGVGGAILLGGAIRWALLGSRQRRNANVSVAFSDRALQLGMSGRF